MEKNCFSGNDALARAMAYSKANEERFAEIRKATDKCNSLCNELANLANKAFMLSHTNGVSTDIRGRLEAYADVLSSMSGDLQRAMD